MDINRIDRCVGGFACGFGWCGPSGANVLIELRHVAECSLEAIGQ